MLIVLGLATPVVAFDRFNHETVWVYTKDEITVEWDSQAVDYYEVRLYSHERKGHLALGRTEQTRMVFKTGKSGHFSFEARSCRITLPEDQCSEWATSIEHYYVKDGKTFWIYAVIPPPTQGTWSR